MPARLLQRLERPSTSSSGTTNSSTSTCVRAPPRARATPGEGTSPRAARTCGGPAQGNRDLRLPRPRRLFGRRACSHIAGPASPGAFTT